MTAPSQAQIKMVQESFTKVEPIADAAADIFYNKLFEYDPELKRLFKGDIKDQGKKLMATLKIAIKGLDDLSKLAPVVEELARRHVEYGVKPEDYTPVGNALLFTLQQGLGDAFTPELRQAWVDTYRTMANAMKNAAYG